MSCSNRPQAIRLKAGAWSRIDLLPILALAAVVAWWFWPHLSGEATFIGDSDRMNHFLSWLRHFTNGLRRGYIPTWNEAVFGGYSAVALPYTYPNAFAALAALWPERLLIAAAGWISALLMVLAGWAAYAFAREAVRDRLLAFTAAVLYQSCALPTLKVSQNDMSFAVLIIIPLVMLILRRVRPGNLALSFLGLALLLTHLLTIDFLQKAAYACMLFGAYSLYRMGVTGNWRTPLALGGAAVVAIIASYPRIATVGIELAGSVRHYIGGESNNLQSVYTSIGRFFNFEILRAFDERMLGRTYGEAAAFGNVFNLHEGLLVYSSTFATLLILYGTVRYLPALLAGRRLVDEDVPFHLGVVAFGVFVVLSKFGFAIMYLLMGRVDFIHARILVAAVLSLATLAAVYLDGLAVGRSGVAFPRLAGPQLAALALAAILVTWGIEHLADATAGRPFKLGVAEGFTANLTVSVGSLLRVGSSAFVFAALLAALAFAARQPVRRAQLVAFLAFLAAFQAAAFGAFQISGDQLRAGWTPIADPQQLAGLPAAAKGEPMPFKDAGRLLAKADEFQGPTPGALAAIDARLERDRFRAALVCDPHEIRIFCSTHIANFWRLRLMEGYTSSIPERIETLPWPQGEVSQRSISFESFAALPWPLLSLYNVKYAVGVTPALIDNAVRLPDGTSRELRPDDLEIKESPLPVTPRVFFAAAVAAEPDEAAAREALFPRGSLKPGGYDVRRLSYAEGAVGGQYSTAGDDAIAADFRDQFATMRFPPAPDARFLVVNDRYDPYWRAYVDGKAAPLYATNVAMRGVVVPPGAAEVRMVYRPYDTSGRAWLFYGGGLLLLGVGYWGMGRADRRFATRSLAEMAAPLARRGRRLGGMLARTTLGEDRALLRSLLVVALLWALLVIAKYRHEPAFILLALSGPAAALLFLQADARLPAAPATALDRLDTGAAFLFMLGIWSASFILWRHAGGFFGIRDTGESAAIYLSSFHVKDVVSFFLQDHAASSDPAALGYYYIHHPNFVSRLFAMTGIALGLRQETLILVCLMLSALALLIGYRGLARLFGPVAALATIGFFATSYGVYFAEAGDLLRGLHAALFWLLVYLTALEFHAPPTRGRTIALAVLFALFASADWAFFLFCLGFYLLWSSYAAGRVPLRHLARVVVLPVALTFLVYFAVIIAHTGVRFFAIDLLVTYFGRMGHVLSGPLFGRSWDPAQFLPLYREHHIVMWDVNPAPVRLRDIVTSYWQVMSGGGAWVGWLLFVTFLAAAGATLMRLSRSRLLRIAALGVLGMLACGYVEAALLLLLIAYLLIALPRLGRHAAFDGSPAARLQALSVWLTIVLATVSLVAILLPDYVSWLWSQGASPVGIADAAAFGLLAQALLYQKPLRAALSAIARLPATSGGDRLFMRAAAALLVLLIGLHLFANLRLYRQEPPLGPPFAATLREPQFHGKLFVANVYDALVWYFTRGTSLSATVVPPEGEESKRFRHLRDGDDAKYARPDYLLCDNDPYFAFQRVARVGGKLCQMPEECSCRDVMAEMAKAGHSAVVVAPDYVIMKYNYPQ